MDTWVLLQKELSYYGIRLINDRKCEIRNNEGKIKTQGIIRSIRELNQSIKKQKNNLLFLWKGVVDILQMKNYNRVPIDNKMVDLFVFSLKDLSKFLLCFEDMDESEFQEAIDFALNQDIKSFNKEQIYTLPDYKISIDWIHRYVSRMLYISNLLSFAAIGKKHISKYDLKLANTVKLARGISGPWSNLDLPFRERIFPFGQEVKKREKAKRRQRRYRKGLENYNAPGVGEGHYWRELRNEPFSWNDRKTEDPYPHRNIMTR